MDTIKIQCKCRHEFSKTGICWGIFIHSNQLLKAVENLFEASFFLEDISALDSIEGFMAVYHFSAWSDADRIALYVVVPHDDPEIPSISGIYGGARWHERETMDFFGIRFTGHPDLRPIFLPEGMTDHPLVKGDKDRAPLKDILNPGEIIAKDPDFTFFESKAENDNSA